MSKHSSKGRDWNAIRSAVLQRDGYLCAYCNREADTVDHIVPKAKGGTDEITNLVSACLECNGRKQDKTIVRLTWFNPRWF